MCLAKFFLALYTFLQVGHSNPPGVQQSANRPEVFPGFAVAACSSDFCLASDSHSRMEVDGSSSAYNIRIVHGPWSTRASCSSKLFVTSGISPSTSGIKCALTVLKTFRQNGMGVLIITEEHRVCTLQIYLPLQQIQQI